MGEKKGRGSIAAKVEDIIRREVEQAGYLLWDVDYYKEGADYNLLVTIEDPERKRPIGLEDCEKVTRRIDPLLDEADPIPQAYYLEVSSPGLERVLSRPEHFAFFEGKPVTVRLYAPREGKKSLAGTLLSYGPDTLTLGGPEGEVVLNKAEVARVTAAEE